MATSEPQLSPLTPLALPALAPRRRAQAVAGFGGLVLVTGLILGPLVHWGFAPGGLVVALLAAWVTARLSGFRYQTVRRAIIKQLVRRGEVPAAVWGPNRRRQACAEQVVARMAVIWPVPNFLPEDPLPIVVGACFNRDESLDVIAGLVHSLIGHSPDEPTLEQLQNGTLGELVDYVLARQEPYEDQ